MKESNSWNATKYSKHGDFVSNLALPLIDLLEPKANENILDLGCGDGTLAYEIKKYDVNIIGIDLSSNMVEQTKAKGIEAYVSSATSIKFINKFDAVFSNAVLHWVKDSKLAIEQIHKSLKDNGRFITEFGAKNNIQALVDAMQVVFNKHKEYGEFKNPWNFKSEEEYKQLLEENGFNVEHIKTIIRPTKIDDILNWLDVFANGIISNLNEEQKINFKNEVKEILKTKLYSSENGWEIDYVRLRIKATKV